jgi:arylsulfatase A-like enzyme
MAAPSTCLAAPENRPPNVLFISVDDLNDWVGCLGGHPQSLTPNIDRLAAEGVLFRNAYTAAASCNPSRSAIFTGIAPYKSGLYDNRDNMRELMLDEKTFGGDCLVAEWIGKELQKKQEQPFFLASIHFADAMVGRVLDDLAKSPNADNTIVVLWSDHGWHLGEKEHWQKFTAWRACARVPLIVRVPKGVPGLPAGTTAGGICDRPVGLIDLFATLTDLCGVPAKPGIDGRSLAPLLRDPKAEWPHAAITHLHEPQDYSVSTERLRYLHYTGGGEELYDITNDPHEWTNLAGNSEHKADLIRLRALAPKDMTPVRKP